MTKKPHPIKLENVLFSTKRFCGYIGHEDIEASYIFPARNPAYSDAYRCEDCVSRWTMTTDSLEKDQISVNAQDFHDVRRRRSQSAKSSSKYYAVHKDKILSQKKIERELTKSLHDTQTNVCLQQDKKEARIEAIRENRRKWGRENKDRRRQYMRDYRRRKRRQDSLSTEEKK